MTSAAPTPPVEPSVPATGAPSPSTVAYLFADRFVLGAKPGKTGMKAFGTGEVVDTGELAGGLVAIALWQLREHHAVTLEQYSGKRLGFVPVSGVRVHPTAGAPVFGGVEGSVQALLTRSNRARERGMTAWDIANIMCLDGKQPQQTIIRMAIDQAVQLGLLDRIAGEAGVVGRLTGKPGTRLEGRAEALAALRPTAESLAVAWRDFRQGEEGLARLLRSTTYDGIASRVRGRSDD